MSAPRRNGQLSSCEPCRKSKLRCDHSTPTCKRCERRGKSDLCVYHPAPLTKPRQSGQILKATQKSTNPQPLLCAKTISVTNLGSSASVSLLGAAQFPNVSKRHLSGSGFLGPTSYSGSVFSNEVELELGIRASLSKADTPLDPQRVNQGAQVLSLLEHLDLYEKLIENRNKIIPGWFFGPPLLRPLIARLRASYRNATAGSDNKYARLMDLSRVLFKNSAAPIETKSSMSLSDYLSQSTLRWDMIGLVFAQAGSATFQVLQQELDNIFKEYPGTTKEGLCQMTDQATEACLQFCNYLGIISDPLSWTMIQHMIFLSSLHGSCDHRTWQMLGDLTTTVFALGIHQSAEDSETPFFLGEIRKRAMVAAYALDKDLATCLGRPPRICWRYCNIQFPLDIDYDELVAEPAVREAALQHLDAAGWNKDGRLDKGARARGVLIASLLRESVLEVSLSHELDGLEERVLEVCRRSDEYRLGMPEHLQWTDNKEDLSLASLHLEFLYQQFLLFQTLFKRIGKGLDLLIRTSSEIITLLLKMISIKSRQGLVPAYVKWDLCYIGLPAAGVLSIELLRRSQTQPLTLLAPPLPPFPRSEIIQKLSVFIAQFNTFVPQNEGDYEISNRGQKVISQALDRVLSGVPSSISPSEAVVSDGATIGDDMEFMAFLENFDWEQEVRLALG
ncbi:putative chromatin structure remodeling complex protein RSC3 [Aspergillus aculeatinus CBS 121060]|uniref:Chromatin structure remodeling complex protein RSC3 n=1 Tax=Aspergillus aculeatinus CBS 121060 TaxID=1448322 RepID=A0ACD1HMC4_9EURO|nr:chromatin structure remodeling complex protein RSC3 [Aspergillus aculeatinus CBS 121060]RAH75009.1 chromatin structure remodeling complex protein RSC3 [Aspergillus aculeatinus CBS 121060]